MVNTTSVAPGELSRRSPVSHATLKLARRFRARTSHVPSFHGMMEHLEHLVQHRDIFPGRDHENATARALRGDIRIWLARRIGLGIQFQAQAIRSSTNHRSNFRGMFADAGGEDHPIDAPHYHGEPADCPANTVYVDAQSQPRLLMAALG